MLFLSASHVMSNKIITSCVCMIIYLEEREM